MVDRFFVLGAATSHHEWTATGDRLYASVLGKQPYDLRHACGATWLAAGVPSTQVAEWAGHSVAVLHQIYAKVIAGQESAALERTSAALGLEK